MGNSQLRMQVKRVIGSYEIHNDIQQLQSVRHHVGSFLLNVDLSMSNLSSNSIIQTQYKKRKWKLV